MFGALMFGQGYFAQGPPGTATLDPLRPIALCKGDIESLMTSRDVFGLTAVRDLESLMTVRDVELHCEGEST